jgi:hypothetical protein
MSNVIDRSLIHMVCTSALRGGAREDRNIAYTAMILIAVTISLNATRLLAGIVRDAASGARDLTAMTAAPVYW